MAVQTINPHHMDDPKKRGGYVEMTNMIAVLNRVPSSQYRLRSISFTSCWFNFIYCSDVPLPNCSPQQLFKSGAFTPGPEDRKLLRPYEEFVLKVGDHF